MGKSHGAGTDYNQRYIDFLNQFKLLCQRQYLLACQFFSYMDPGNNGCNNAYHESNEQGMGVGQPVNSLDDVFKTFIDCGKGYHHG